MESTWHTRGTKTLRTGATDSSRSQDPTNLRFCWRVGGFIADREFVMFKNPDKENSRDSSDRGQFSASAIDKVCAAGLLPSPNALLPSVGDSVEAMVIAGKPPPACRYGVGTVTALEWDWIFQTWRVHVRFNQRTGGWCGFPIMGTSTFPFCIHVIGSSGRPFSDMTPGEIQDLHEERRQHFWRQLQAANVHIPKRIAESLE